MSAAAKILVIRSSSLGDVVHGLPVAADIKRALPGARLDWVIEESFTDLLALNRYIDQPLVSAFRRWRRQPLRRDTWAQLSAFRRRLREERYDLVIDLQGLLRSALVARWAGTRAIGYSRPQLREPLAALCYDETRDAPASLGPVRRYRLMASLCLGYEPRGEPDFGLRPEPRLPPGLAAPYAVLLTNTSRPSKMWPVSGWREVAGRLLERGLRPTLVWRSEAELDYVTSLAASVPGTLIMPRLSLPEVAGLLAGAALIVGLDTGLTHLAAALGRPVVAIFVDSLSRVIGLTGPGPLRVLGDRHVSVSAAAVIAACDELGRAPGES